MRVVRYGTQGWERYRASLPRAGAPSPRLERKVSAILGAVRKEGDRALVRLTRRFDQFPLELSKIRVAPEEIRDVARRAEPGVVRALKRSARSIEAYHKRQKGRGFRLALPGGGALEEVVAPLRAVGLYVPGGQGAYPSSVLMNAIPARIAGVGHIAVVTPPRTLESNPAVAAALETAGVDSSVYRIGGAQAIAALAFGTDTVAAVDKIVGPGNAFVAAAKRQVRGLVEIDHEAGPSEVAILADETADASFVAADLLAQAEHGSGEEAVVLVTTSSRLAGEVPRLVKAGLESVANARSARRAVVRSGAVVLVRSLEEGVEAINALAPEHVEIQAARAERLVPHVVAGAVFVGSHAPVAVGDYGIGPNHVLPTGGAARYSSGLSVRDFERHQSVVRMTPLSLRRIAETLTTLAEAEGFKGHASSIALRFAERGMRGR